MNLMLLGLPLQMWELTESGALVNSYYGLCAVVNLAEGTYFFVGFDL